MKKINKDDLFPYVNVIGTRLKDQRRKHPVDYYWARVGRNWVRVMSSRRRPLPVRTLAEATGVSVNMIQKLEAGHRVFYDDMLFKLLVDGIGLKKREALKMICEWRIMEATKRYRI